ncbi:MAG: phosphoribosylaminoimidazolesuccinocarboxamide synthase [Humidesulfovibrio sp.]|uniref:phosphoribosylaminoimidazolesuccinocarboxamide synthase n=1 Tax=Humidesulfovibrio sp. TaxID=2910988 RepID=UPI0027353B28|nr:phosphoribosylaminoimidazolesuccinocarboxamide synthase [Humidesulfovibrio sp.]MDP2848868.1 phosphoribosylaminoimidazolesuccinocarboxamide synthase [Humidesulfovibrio sp.]
MDCVTTTDIKELPLLSRGKVRDIYEAGPDSLLIITTDRISAFDVIMDDPIPHKGVVLNQITLFWMEMFKDLVPNHLLATDVKDFPKVLAPHASMLEGRSVLVKRAKPLAIECIVRGYITGSGWKDYLKTGSVCGHKLPEGLRESDKLEKPLFTPSTKAELGAHDENISVAEAMRITGESLATQAQDLTIGIYSAAREYAEKRGIIIADTKFEFGTVNEGGQEKLILIDEVLTPDSSRFWPMSDYAPGRGQQSFDKQFLRDWLEEIKFDKRPPAPKIPQEIIDQTRAKYLEAYRLLTGRDLGV